MRVRLQTWPALAARVPKGEYFELTTADAIVNVITNAGEMQTSYASRASIGHGRSNARLRAQKRKSLREILIEGLGCKFAIFVPPLSGTINLSLRAFGDANVHSPKLAVTTSKLRKHLLDGNGFPALGFGNGKEQFRFLFRR